MTVDMSWIRNQRRGGGSQQRGGGRQHSGGYRPQRGGYQQRKASDTWLQGGGGYGGVGYGGPGPLENPIRGGGYGGGYQPPQRGGYGPQYGGYQGGGYGGGYQRPVSPSGGFNQPGGYGGGEWANLLRPPQQPTRPTQLPTYFPPQFPTFNPDPPPQLPNYPTWPPPQQPPRQNAWHDIFGGQGLAGGIVDYAQQQGYENPVTWTQPPLYGPMQHRGPVDIQPHGIMAPPQGGMEGNRWWAPPPGPGSGTMQVTPEMREPLQAFLSYMHLQNQRGSIDDFKWPGHQGSNVPWERQRNPWQEAQWQREEMMRKMQGGFQPPLGIRPEHMMYTRGQITPQNFQMNQGGNYTMQGDGRGWPGSGGLPPGVTGHRSPGFDPRNRQRDPFEYEVGFGMQRDQQRIAEAIRQQRAGSHRGPQIPGWLQGRGNQYNSY